MNVHLTPCVKRLQKEIQKLTKDPPPPEVVIKPDHVDIMKWYFVFHNLDGKFTNGQYYGSIEFPQDYPSKAPKFKIFTPNGRFETNKYLCTTFSSYHNDQWSPLWNTSKMVLGLLSFFTQSTKDSKTQGVGRMISTIAQIKTLANNSKEYNAKDPIFQKIFPELIDESYLYREIDAFFEKLTDKQKEYLKFKFEKKTKEPMESSKEGLTS